MKIVSGTALVRHLLSLLPEHVPVKVGTFLETDIQGKVARGFHMSLGFRPKELEEDTERFNAGHPFRVFPRIMRALSTLT